MSRAYRHRGVKLCKRPQGLAVDPGNKGQWIYVSAPRAVKGSWIKTRGFVHRRLEFQQPEHCQKYTLMGVTPKTNDCSDRNTRDTGETSASKVLIWISFTIF